ncbi:acetylcholinesterase isoform X3 [Rhipicephalus sanguineus]|uniref:acetylcholinesterase isoform X3 n=1 Tax=Rhipicephalus sanguineus TaxID=34632 RepID=UPI0020C35281|nr:acetylcholinesterase isoform X3 [Rhipicephalus sanguineus]
MRRYLSALGGVIVVVPNYRVGSLAFVSSGDDSDEDEPGNLALLDQRMALEWVRSHIDDFDGDPGSIVVAGAGSGASSLALHLLSPEAQGTMMDLRRFMLHSPSVFGPFADQSVPRQVLMGNVADEGLQEFSSFNETLPTGLSPDTVLHKFLPRELAKHGVHDAKALLRVYLNDTTGLSWDETQSLVSHLLGDLLYVCPTTFLAQYLSWGFENQVYTFRMSQRLSYIATNTMTRYEDVDLVFGRPLRQPGATEAEKSLSREIIRAWSNFAKFGNLPVVNDSSSGTTIEWPAHSDSEHATVDISASGFSLVPDEHWGHCFQLRALAAADVV